MSSDLIRNVSIESLRDQLQRFGYRAEIVSGQGGFTLLRSATSGLNFDIHPGNRLAGAEVTYADFSFLALFKIEGELPLGLVNTWNNQRRFGRLHVDQGFLALNQDVSVAGGIAPEHLRAQLEIWDQLLQGLVTYLRTELPRLTASPVPGPSTKPASAA